MFDIEEVSELNRMEKLRSKINNIRMSDDDTHIAVTIDIMN